MDRNLAEVIKFALVGGTILTAVAMVLLAFRRRGAGPSPAASAEVTARLERIEQAVDTIAIEIERVSEGQRFTSKLLAEKEAPGRVPARQITPH